MTHVLLKKNHLALLTVLLMPMLPLLFPLHVANAAQGNGGITVQIEFLDGKKATLSSPLHIKGAFETENYGFHPLIDTIESIDRSDDQMNPKGFILKLRIVDTPIKGAFSKNSDITGSGDWGDETFSINEIQSMRVTNAEDIKPAELSTKWRCTFTNGEQLTIDQPGKFFGKIFGDVTGSVGKAQVSLDFSRITNIRKTNDTLSISGSNGFMLDGFKPGLEAIRVFTVYKQYVELTWDKIADITKLDESEKASTTPHTNAFTPAWQMVVDNSLTMPLLDLQTGSKAEINNELNVHSLNWNFIDAVTPNSTWLQLHLHNGDSLLFGGNLVGSCPVGSFTAPARHITGLTRLGPPPQNRLPMEYTGKVSAAIATTNGAEYPVVHATLKGGDPVIDDKDFWGHDLIIIKSDPVEFWLDPQSALSHNLARKDDEVISEYPDFASFKFYNLAEELEFVNPAGKFSISIKKLSKYTVTAPAPSSGDLSPRKYKINVRDYQNRAFEAEVTDIQFARYPSLAWSGTYFSSSFPFQWHRDPFLIIKKREKSQSSLFAKSADDFDAEINIHFDKLSSIKFTRSYFANRKAVLRNNRGAVLNGSIYPGPVAEQFPGVTKWDPNKEGLLCEITNRLYVFIRFCNVVEVEITDIAGQ